MIGSDNSSPPYERRREESEDSPIDREEGTQQNKSSERAYRHYARKVYERLRHITHEQHLAYGTWGLAIATWILALLAYCALHDNETISSQGQRAWVGPNQADFIAQLTVNTEAALAIQYQNTGRVPALSVSATGDTMLFTLDESRSGKLQEDVHKSLERCLARKLSKEDSAVYPATGFNNYRMYVNIDKDIIDWDVIYGKKILVLEGCFVYETFSEIHRSAFCYFYQAGITKTNSWAFCPTGHHAD